MSWLAPGRRVFVLRDCSSGPRTDVRVARAEIVENLRSRVVVRYEDGSTDSVKTGCGAGLIWASEEKARDALTARTARRAPSVAETVTNGVPGGVGRDASRKEEPAQTGHAVRGPGRSRAENPGNRSRPLGAYVRYIVAASVGVAAQRVPLARIDLGADEFSLTRELADHFAQSLDELTIEQRILWGALTLYVVAREGAGDRVPTFLEKGVPRSLLPVFEEAVSFWKRKGVYGADEAFAFLCARISVNEVVDRSELPIELDVSRAPPMLGRDRVRVRAIAADVDGGAVLTIAFRVPERPDIKVLVEDAPGATLTDAGVRLPICDEWTDVLFRLVGRRSERAPLEIFVVGFEATSVPVEGEFVVGADECSSESPPCVSVSGADDPPVRSDVAASGPERVLKHIQLHGSITELDAVRLLGSPRAFRAFSIRIDSYAKALPFRVRVEATPDGKRYVREES